MPRNINKFGDQQKPLYVETPIATIEKLDELVKRSRTNRSAYIRKLLEDHIKAVEEEDELARALRSEG